MGLLSRGSCTCAGANADNAMRIVTQLLDVAVRVDGVREYSVHCMSALIREQRIKDPGNSMSLVFMAAAWIIGEYAEYGFHWISSIVG